MFADLVLFDPATVADRAHAARAAPDVGRHRAVWVNGAEVFADGKTTGAKPGRVIRRQN
jgi:N-acyl-D-amino-acid deacylase